MIRISQSSIIRARFERLDIWIQNRYSVLNDSYAQATAVIQGSDIRLIKRYHTLHRIHATQV